MPAGRLRMICRRPKKRRTTTSSSNACGGNASSAFCPIALAMPRPEAASALRWETGRTRGLTWLAARIAPRSQMMQRSASLRHFQASRRRLEVARQPSPLLGAEREHLNPKADATPRTNGEQQSESASIVNELAICSKITLMGCRAGLSGRSSPEWGRAPPRWPNTAPRGLPRRQALPYLKLSISAESGAIDRDTWL